jgi:hypothetical protein
MEGCKNPLLGKVNPKVQRTEVKAFLLFDLEKDSYDYEAAS